MAAPALAPLARYVTNAVVSAAPEIKAKAMTYISKATDGRIGVNVNQKALENYASNSTQSFAVVASAGVSAGLAPESLFNERLLRELGNRDIDSLYSTMKSEFNRIYGAIDAKSTFLSPEQKQTAQDLMAIGVINHIRALGLFSGNDIAKTHVNLRLFLAMSEDEISRAKAMGW